MTAPASGDAGSASAAPPAATTSQPSALDAANSAFERTGVASASTDALHMSYKFKEDASEESKKTLTSTADWASKLLETLTTPKANDADFMPPGVLNACEGLAFIRCTKAGFGLSLAGADGFVIRKLDQDRHGHSIWSAPIFIKVAQAGFGITAGYEHVESVMALMNVHTVNRFATSHTIAGTDLALVSTNTGVTGVPAGTFGPMSNLEITADRETNSFCYSQSNGALLNLSINGTKVSPDAKHNTSLYGEGADLEAVLAGGHCTFKELLPLYRKIQALASKAASA